MTKRGLEKYRRMKYAVKHRMITECLLRQHSGYAWTVIPNARTKK